MATTLSVVLGGLVVYLLTYRLWGKHLERRLVQADDTRETPAQALFDGVDYVPALPGVLFGHHFASIAGAAPIVGPIIALAWGWLPALLWVWFGNVLIGAIHDYLSLMASVRHRGRSIQWIAGEFISRRTSYLFRVFILFTLILVIGAFASIIATIFVKNPAVGTASLLFIGVAVITGFVLYRTPAGLLPGTLLGLGLLAGAIAAAPWMPLRLTYNQWLLVLLVYMTVAASLPVWVLLQPRDYLNAFLLWGGLALGALVLILLHHALQVPAYTRWSAPVIAGHPSPFWPVIPLIIACGSLSGFHSLVASGTTSKQLARESHGLFVGFGGMLTEGFLSTTVIAVVGAFGVTVLQAKGLLGGGDFARAYGKALGEIGGPVGMFAHSYAEAVARVVPTISKKLVVVFASLWVSAFALTTLDTTARLARFTLAELLEPLRRQGEAHPLAFLENKWVASFAVSLAGLFLAFGALWKVLWPSFGGANQLLASIALFTVSAWVLKELRHAGLLYRLAVLLPALFLWVTITAALLWYLVVPLRALLQTHPAQAVLLMGIVLVELFLNLLLLADGLRSVRRPLAEPLSQ